MIQQGYQVLLPEISLDKRRHSRWVEVIEPLFPGYLFVRIVFGHDHPAPIRSTRGRHDLVPFGEHHPLVPEEVLERLIGQAASATGRSSVFSIGETLHVESVPLAGLTAVFEMPNGNDRAKVLIQMLGKVQRVVIDSDQLSKNSE